MRTTLARTRACLGGRSLLTAAAAMVGLPACSAHRSPEQPTPVHFVAEVRSMLAVSEPSPEYYRARTELDGMGPEVEAVLVAIARDPDSRPVTRSNALMLLAERRSPAAIPAIRRILLGGERESLRASAVLALQRMLPDVPEASNLIRTAVSDRSRTVRLNALQALDVADVELIRQVLDEERDPEVRRVGLQLVSLAEARGAPLERDRRGAFRTAADQTDPQIVFRPVRSDTVAGHFAGDLRLEMPTGPDIPLAPMAEVVAGVVPAFFSPDRGQVVYEVDREIRVVDLRSREHQSFGPGIAPRPIPFSDEFVFLRAVTSQVREDGATALTYEVRRASFGGGSESIGEIQALARPERFGNYSPARWMVVGESAEGWVLRGDGISTFKLPSAGVTP